MRMRKPCKFKKKKAILKRKVQTLNRCIFFIFLHTPWCPKGADVGRMLTNDNYTFLSKFFFQKVAHYFLQICVNKKLSYVLFKKIIIFWHPRIKQNWIKENIPFSNEVKICWLFKFFFTSDFNPLKSIVVIKSENKTYFAFN